MKPGISVKLLIGALLFMLAYSIWSGRRASLLSRQLNIEVAKTNFLLKQTDSKNAAFDSVHAN